MKTILILLLFAVQAFSQVTHTFQSSNTFHDGNTSDVFYLYFPEPSMIAGRIAGGNRGINSDTTATNANTVMFNNKYTAVGYLDSLKASTVIDSIWGRVRPIDFDKKPFGDYYYFDIANGDSAVAIDYVENAIPQNRDASDTPTSATFSINFDGILPLCNGLEIEIGMSQIAAADSVRCRMNHMIGVSK